MCLLIVLVCDIFPGGMSKSSFEFQEKLLGNCGIGDSTAVSPGHLKSPYNNSLQSARDEVYWIYLYILYKENSNLHFYLWLEDDMAWSWLVKLEDFFWYFYLWLEAD